MKKLARHLVIGPPGSTITAKEFQAFLDYHGIELKVDDESLVMNMLVEALNKFTDKVEKLEDEIQEAEWAAMGDDL